MEIQSSDILLTNLQSIFYLFFWKSVVYNVFRIFVCSNFWICYQYDKTSVIRQKGESQNGYFKKTKNTKVSENRIFLTFRTCAYQGVRNVRFSENLACLVHLKHLFKDSTFCPITTDEKLKQFYGAMWWVGITSMFLVVPCF